MDNVRVKIKHHIVIEWECLICNEKQINTWTVFGKMYDIPLQCKNCDREFYGYLSFGEV